MSWQLNSCALGIACSTDLNVSYVLYSVISVKGQVSLWLCCGRKVSILPSARTRYSIKHAVVSHQQHLRDVVHLKNVFIACQARSQSLGLCKLLFVCVWIFVYSRYRSFQNYLDYFHHRSCRLSLDIIPHSLSELLLMFWLILKGVNMNWYLKFNWLDHESFLQCFGGIKVKPRHLQAITPNLTIYFLGCMIHINNL